MKRLAINPKRVLYILLGLALLQLIAYMLVAYLKPGSLYVNGFWDLLNIDQEASVQTWYSQFLFLVPAILMAWLAAISNETRDRWYWGGL